MREKERAPALALGAVRGGAGVGALAWRQC